MGARVWGLHAVPVKSMVLLKGSLSLSLSLSLVSTHEEFPGGFFKDLVKDFLPESQPHRHLQKRRFQHSWGRTLAQGVRRLHGIRLTHRNNERYTCNSDSLILFAWLSKQMTSRYDQPVDVMLFLYMKPVDVMLFRDIKLVELRLFHMTLVDVKLFSSFE